MEVFPEMTYSGLRLTSSSAKHRGILSVSVSVGYFRFAAPPDPNTVRICVGFMDCHESSEVGLLVPRVPHLSPSSGSRPRDSSPRSCSDSQRCFCPGESGRLRWTRSYFVLVSSSRALHLQLHRFMILRGTDCSPEWFRLLSDCLGRTDRHRRTGGNRSVSNLIPTHM